MEPAIVAGLHSHPELPKDINVVACNSTLGNLLRLIRRQNKSFRILVILVDQTLFLIRRENSPTEIMQDVRGFGHTFPKAYTTWGPDVTQSESHQRLLRYAFGDLQLLVRFEADGYLPQSHDKAIQQVQSRPKTNDHFDVNILTESFKTSEILSEGDPAIVSSTSDKLDVQQAGDVVSQSSIFDLKTRIMKKKDHEILSGEIPRLWVAHISNFVVAYHERGMFKPENINIQNVSWDIAKWEKDKNSELAQLVALLHSLIYKAREKETGRFEMFKSEGGNLELRRTLADAGDALSAGVKKKWLRSSEATSMGSEKVDLKGTMTVGVLAWEDAQNSDYTACSDACNYCGSCTY
ncbi:hypothetical protein BJ878DRAFT_435570 [Calycina marina]|uniref:Uncharacterized protein n=1 Tax=Calycina marina TaxID=1763456 RepID=A0A9P8CHU9_9HELO|nr:hypothetical protein BJ878DRAFT_435570 [Calycina marina]